MMYFILVPLLFLVFTVLRISLHAFALTKGYNTDTPIFWFFSHFIKHFRKTKIEPTFPKSSLSNAECTSTPNETNSISSQDDSLTDDSPNKPIINPLDNDTFLKAFIDCYNSPIAANIDKLKAEIERNPSKRSFFDVLVGSILTLDPPRTISYDYESVSFPAAAAPVSPRFHSHPDKMSSDQLMDVDDP